MSGARALTHEDRNALAKLIIRMCAIVVWALSGKNKELYGDVKEQGEMEWQKLTGK